MPTYFYWGEDEYRMTQAVKQLRDRALDPAWVDFNYAKLSGATEEQAIAGLSQAVTPPFGTGDRVTWLADVTLTQRCSKSLLVELERTLKALPESSHLLLTAAGKPDGRLKSTKLLQKWATVVEFSPIPAWKQEEICKLVRQFSAEIALPLTEEAVEALADASGGDSRRLAMELEKLKLWHAGRSQPLTPADIAPLVVGATRNSLHLAKAILHGQVGRGLDVLGELLRHNEPGLRIAATLTGQFRTWLWVKLMQEAGERDDRAIAEAAELGNPKRVYFLKQEVRDVTSAQLLQALPVLLRLEAALKRGSDEMATLQTAIVECCQQIRAVSLR